jgi:hypothetical protein
MSATLDVTTLRRVYENAEVMALKRRFDQCNPSGSGKLIFPLSQTSCMLELEHKISPIGVLSKEDFARQYWTLCPWARGSKADADLFADFEAMGTDSVCFVDFLAFACAVITLALLSLLTLPTTRFLNVSFCCSRGDPTSPTNPTDPTRRTLRCCSPMMW